jgi:hypothetical protein
MRSRQQRHPRPSHPNPTFVTIAKRPFVVGRDGEKCRTDLGPMASIISDFPKFFFRRRVSVRLMVCSTGQRA